MAEDDLSYGEPVVVAWGLADVIGTVHEVYGPPARKHVVVKLRRVRQDGVIGPYPVGSDAAFEVRGLTSKNTLGEDPVTGSLNAAIAQWLIPLGHAPHT